MEVVVLGRGLASMGLIEAINHKNPEWEVKWIGPNPIDLGWSNCSRNSTAVVGLHGIQKGVSPLGDDLVEAFHHTKDFINQNCPQGVRGFKRFHLCHGEGSKSHNKLIQRFGSLKECQVFDQKLLGVTEDVYVFEPLVFLKWWQNRLSQKRVSIKDDFVVDINNSEQVAVGLEGRYSYDYLFDCRGSLSDEVKKAPGHYWVWDIDHVPEDFVLTLDGHNLILDQKRNQIILGGTTEKSEIIAPQTFQLKSQRDSFTQVLPHLNNLLNQKDPKVLTGTRPKASKRRPLLKKTTDNYIVLNGFYKNGYSLCHTYGKHALNLL